MFAVKSNANRHQKERPMLTLYHSPMSRSSRMVQLLEEMNIADQVEIRVVDIQRSDGSGRHDPDNPHPEGKVPLLVHDGVEIRESNAIMLYLTDMFPDSGMGVPVGDPKRGEYLAWLFWYGNVLEPTTIHAFAGLEHPALTATFRGIGETTNVLEKALTNSRFLLGDRFTAADLICVSPYVWSRELTPDVPRIRDWIERCQARSATPGVIKYDQQLMT